MSVFDLTKGPNPQNPTFGQPPVTAGVKSSNSVPATGLGGLARSKPNLPSSTTTTPVAPPSPLVSAGTQQQWAASNARAAERATTSAAAESSAAQQRQQRARDQAMGGIAALGANVDTPPIGQAPDFSQLDANPAGHAYASMFAGNSGAGQAAHSARPSKDEFMAKARAANPGVSEKQLEDYYQRKYRDGGQP